MRRILPILLLFLTPILWAQTIPVTPNLGLQLIPDGYQNWGVPYRQTMTTIDTWSATVALRASPTFSGTITFPITGSTQCLHVNSSGIVSGSGVDCGTETITSVFTRTGAVTAQSGDYSFSQISGSLNLASQVTGTLAAGNVATLNQSTTGNAATATALATTPTLCSTGQAPTGVLANGNATGCAALATGSVTAVSIASANGVSGTSSGGATPALTLTLGAITPTSVSASTFTVTGSGIPISTGTTSNTDLAGQITLSGGTGTYSLTATYATAPIVVCSDTTAAAAVKCVATTTTVTATGTGTDIINYIIVGRT